MGETKRSQELDRDRVLQHKTRKRVDSREVLSINKAKNLLEYVRQNTALKGRGYLACSQEKCLYYGRENFLGDEDEVLKEYVKNYHPDREVVFVWQVSKDSALFNMTILPFESLLVWEQEWKR